MAEKHFLCRAEEVPDAAAKIVAFRSLSIGVFRLPDGYHALLNVCPHNGAALCEGPVCGTTEDAGDRDFAYVRAGELVRCAWHGWEFDIRTGQSLIDPSLKARRFTVTEEEGAIFVHL